jgi:bacteriocin-like protein
MKTISIDELNAVTGGEYIQTPSNPIRPAKQVNLSPAGAGIQKWDSLVKSLGLPRQQTNGLLWKNLHP